MRPCEKTFDEWREFYFSTEPKSDNWKEALDNMRLTAKYSEDWQEYSRILDYDGFPINHPEVVIATNGIFFAPIKSKIEKCSFFVKIIKVICAIIYFRPMSMIKTA
jgi:hypothetical protein